MTGAVVRSLALRLWAAQAAVGAAVAALVAVGALVEGRAPSPRALASAGLLAGGLIGAAWALGRWRAEGGDVALANVGVAPGRVVGLLAALSLPALLAAPSARSVAAAPEATLEPRAGWAIELAPAALRVAHPRGAVEVEWRDGIARRSDTGDRFTELPPPGSATDGAGGPPPWAVPATRTGLLLALLTALGARRSAPGPALTLGAALVATALVQAAGALASP